MPAPYVAQRISLWPAFRARHTWGKAVDQWARDTGWPDDLPVSNARNLARTRLPWSRKFLLDRGEVEYVAWLEGRRPANPGRGR